jgi:hypothetical protein
MASSPRITDMRTALAAKSHAKSQLAVFGWSASEWSCLSSLWGRESAWNPNSRNKTAVQIYKNGKLIKVHAGGIPQILGMNPRLSVPEQVNRGLTYVKARYGSPCKAKYFWDRHNWY